MCENRTEASNTDLNLFQIDRTTAARMNLSEVAQVATWIAAVLKLKMLGQGRFYPLAHTCNTSSKEDAIHLFHCTFYPLNKTSGENIIYQ